MHAAQRPILKRLPWFDRTGRVSPFKAGVLFLIVFPAFWLAVEAWERTLGPRPFTEAIHQSGLMAIRLIAFGLAVTPLRLASRWFKLNTVRRMLGVGAAGYALLHFGLYILDQKFDLLHVAAEIALRYYLTIGFVALLGLSVLAATSTDAMIRRIGTSRWEKLHRIVYAIAVLGTVHFFMQSKLDVSEPTIMAGIFALLLAQRGAQRLWGDLAAWQLALLALVTAGLVALAEACWFAYSTGAPFDLVLSANLDFSYSVRPAWYVVGTGAALVIARLMRPWVGVRRSRPLARRDKPAPAE